MKTEEQNRAIAEACGWSLIERRPSITGKAYWLSGLNPNPNKIELVIDSETGNQRKPNEGDYGWESIPRYTECLNACADFESKANYHVGDYCRILSAITSGGKVENMTQYNLLHATAPQRCEAFLKAKGLWTETPADNDDE